MPDYTESWSKKFVRDFGKKRGNALASTERKRSGFERGRHHVVGAELKRISAFLSSLAVEAGAAYTSCGKRSKVTHKADKALAAVNELRNALDDALAEESTQREWEDENLQRVYYGIEDKI